MKSITIITTLFLSFSLTACSPGGEQNKQEGITKNVDAVEFHQLYTDKGGQMVDVRTAEELQGGYIPNAVNIDFYNENFEKQLAELDKDTPVFVYCAAGGRSGKAMNMMKDQGFKEIYNLSGGFGSWAQAGFEVSK